MTTIVSMATRMRTQDGPQAPPAGGRSRLLGGGTDGNERLTAATGALLIVLLAVLGVTILQLRQLLWLHLFLGMLLIGPVALKMGSTIYRFARYYTGARAYRLKGPPPAALRTLGPLVVLLTVVVFASGVALLFTGPAERGTLLPIHKVSFIGWLAVTALHVLGHLAELPRALRGDYARSAGLGSRLGGRGGRTMALAAATVAGVVIAVLVLPEFAAWMHWNGSFHGDH